jgi:hypothetical protein
MDKLSIDISKLQFVKITSEGWQSQCIACAEQNEDQHGRNHLSILRNGVFNCSKYSGDSSHNKRILQLAGRNIDINSTDYVALQKEEPRVTMPKSWNLDVLSGLLPNFKYWNDRGISSETCSCFRMGIAVKGTLAGRIVLPIIDKNNPTKLIGFSGRALKKEIIPKWKHIGEKNRFLIPAIDEEITKMESIILVESPGCFLTLFDYKIKNTLCLFGVNITSGIMAYLIKMNPERILIATNNELDSTNGGVGNRAASKIEKQLLQFFNSERIKIALPDLKDFNLMTPEMIKKYKNDYSL